MSARSSSPRSLLVAGVVIVIGLYVLARLDERRRPRGVVTIVDLN